MKTATLQVDVVWEADGDVCTDLDIQAFCTELFTLLEIDCVELAVLITGDDKMRQLNETYRGLNKATDVLSFPNGGMAPPEGEPRPLGDIAISFERATRQAEEIGHSVNAEVYFLVLHGVLHLLGYDHETDDGEMLRLQSDLKRQLADYFEEGCIVG